MSELMPTQLSDKQLAPPQRQSNQQGLYQRLGMIVDDTSKWQNYDEWSRSPERMQFYQLASKIQLVGGISRKSSHLDLDLDSYSSDQSFEDEVSTPKCQHETTAASISVSKDIPAGELHRMACQKEVQLLRSIQISVVSIRRPTKRHYHPLIVRDSKTFFSLRNLSEASYLVLFDVFRQANPQVFSSYKYFILNSDLSFVNNNPSLPRKFRFLNQQILKKFIVDFYVLNEHYSTQQILEVYDLDVVLDAYFRGVMMAKGCQESRLTDFNCNIQLDDWCPHLERACGIQSKYSVKEKNRQELTVNIWGKLLMIKKEKGRVLIEKP